MSFTETENLQCREDFPSLRRMAGDRPLAYLDGPAGTQVPRQVIEAMIDYYETCNANTHGWFATSVESDRVVMEARQAAAAMLGAPSWREISFGQNTTTLCFSLSHAIARTLRKGDEIVVTQLDHEANRGPWISLEEKGVIIREAVVTQEGVLDYDDLARQINRRTRVVAIGWASNALGTVNDVRLARELSSGVGAWLVVDAVHYAPHFSIDVTALGCDFLLCSAYKFYGPHVGILYSRPGLLDQLPTDRLITQSAAAPERIETGTLNHAALAGVTAAIGYRASWGRGEDLRAKVVSATADMAIWEHDLARYYCENVRAIPGVRAWGPDFSSRMRAPTVSITIDGMSSSEVARRLAERGIAVWNGDFYARRVIEILGLEKQDGIVRAGVAMYNTRDEVDRLLEGVASLARVAV